MYVCCTSAPNWRAAVTEVPPVDQLVLRAVRVDRLRPGSAPSSGAFPDVGSAAVFWTIGTMLPGALTVTCTVSVPVCPAGSLTVTFAV